MAAPWTASCSCGWLAVVGTLDEAGALVETHAEQATKRTPHSITIKGSARAPGRPRRRSRPK
jgi:hypothetical protein